MSTSGSTDFSMNRTSIITDALGMIGVLGNNQTLLDDDASRADRALNRIVKSFENQAEHIWKRSECTIFLQQSQASYTFGNSSTDHATESYVKYVTTVILNTSGTLVTVADTTGVTNGDKIGIVLDSGLLHWTTVVSHTSTTFTITTGVVSAAAVGAVVYTYTTDILKPLNILDIRRRTVSDNTDVPVMEEVYQTFQRLPSKVSPNGTVIKWCFSRKNANGVLYTWPPAADGTYILKATYSKSFEDFDNNSDNPDFPQEWYDVLVEGLAVKLAHYYGKTGTQEYKDLAETYTATLGIALGFDTEHSSINLIPDYRLGRD